MITDARPYANAIFEIAERDGSQAAWNDALQDLAYISADSQFRDYIGSPQVEDQDCKKLIENVIADLKPGWLSSLQQELSNFINLLLEEKRLELLSGIAQVYHEIMIAKEDQQDVVITTAVDMTDAQKDSLRAKLEQRFSGKMNFSYVTDATVIGGLRIEIGNSIIDNTVAGRMSCLKETLERAG